MPTLVMITDIAVIEHIKYFVCVDLVIDQFACHYSFVLLSERQPVSVCLTHQLT